jgi:hypothetical protein
MRFHLFISLLLPVIAAPAADPPATRPTTAPVAEVQADGSIVLAASGARIHGYRLHLESKPIPTLVYWVDADEYPEWPQAAAKKGTYVVEITYSCPARAGGDFAVVAAANRVVGKTKRTADWQTFDAQNLGNLVVLNDDTTIALRCTGRLDHALMNVRSIRLTPVQEQEKGKK